MRVINHIVVHCTATDQTASVAAILNYWKTNLKWQRPGYHYIVKSDGKIEQLLDEAIPSNGVAGHNFDSIHIGWIGGLGGVDNRTLVQKSALASKIKELHAKYPHAKILGHRDFPNVKKSCPAFDVAKFLKQISL